MEPILRTLLLVLSHVVACLWLVLSSLLDLVTAAIRKYTTPPQLVATIEAWELACASGWTEPAPEPVQLPLSVPTEPDPSLIGSGWDSWCGNHWLEDPQIDELVDYSWAD
jgi:hypothetical protein